MKKVEVELTPMKNGEKVSLAFKNVGDECIRLPQHSIILSGSIIDESFKVVDKYGGKELQYEGKRVKVIPLYKNILPEEKVITKEISLASSYPIVSNKVYNVSYSKEISYYGCDDGNYIGEMFLESNIGEILGNTEL